MQIKVSREPFLYYIGAIICNNVSYLFDDTGGGGLTSFLSLNGTEVKIPQGTVIKNIIVAPMPGAIIC